MTSAATSRDQNHQLGQRALQLSLIDGVFYAVMVGCSESYLGVLAVELGHGDTALALLVALPLAVGAVSQIWSGWFTRCLGGRKRFVVAAVLLQALTHVGFAWIALTGHRGLPLLLLLKCLFWIFGMSVGPAWGAWMASLVEGRARERYFAWRSGLVQLTVLFAFWFAGEHLHHARKIHGALGGFPLLLGIALLARSASALALAFQADPHDVASPATQPTQMRAALKAGGWRIASYIALLGLGAFIAVPFFTPYMLRELKLDVRQFALLTAVSICCKALLFPACHHLASRFGLRSLLLCGGIGVATIPLCWALEPNFNQLLWIHALGGVAWAAVEYSSFQLLLSSSEPHLRVDFLAMAGALQGLMQVVGGLLGGLLLDASLIDYSDVFVLSALGRSLPLLLLVTLPLARVGGLSRWAYRLLGVAPVIGARLRPVLPQRQTPAPWGSAGSDLERGPRQE